MNNNSKNPTRNLSILQWNARSLPAHCGELEKYIDDHHPDVICIQETWLSDSRHYDLPGYSHHRHDRKDRNGGGVAIFIKRGIPHQRADINSPMEAVAIRIGSTPTDAITICNVYHTQPKIDETELHLLHQQLPKPTIIVGDFNSHHPAWGGKKANGKGISLLSFITDSQLVILNDGSGTLLKPNGHLSAIDLTMTSPSIAPRCNWAVDYSTTLGSDHYPIFTTISHKVIIEKPDKQRRFNFKKADWPSFSSLCASRINEEMYTNNVELFNKRVVDAITRTAEECIPKTIPVRKKPGAPWWSPKCDEAIAKKKAALHKVRRSRNPDDYRHYATQREACKMVLERAQKDWWKDECSKITKDTRARDLWDKVNLISKGPKDREIPALKCPDGGLITDPYEKAEQLANQYESVSDDSNLSQEFLAYRAEFESKHSSTLSARSENSSPFNSIFTMPELQNALNDAKDTAPGEDGITASMLRHIPGSSLQVILHLFNESWTQGILPSSWKQSLIIPVPKPQKDPAMASSYRPIALTSSLCKLMERMVKTRLVWFLESNNLLSPSQSGFRKKRSTIDNLARLDNSIRISKKNGYYTLSVMIDLEKAFDLLWKKGLIFKLYEMGIRGTMLNWILSFLTDRKFRVKVNSRRSTTRRTKNGSPQGSILSPLLFIILTNLIEKKMLSCKAGWYADDLVIWMSHKNLKHLKKKVNEDMQRIVQELKNWGFRIATQKTVAMVFGNRPVPDDFKITVDGTQIPLSKTTRLLGVTLDSKYNWAAHITSVVNSCEKIISLIRRLCGFKWGAHPKQLMQIYYALIRSRLDYAAELFNSASNSQKKRLDAVQCKALRTILGLPRSTAAEVVLMEAGEKPLQLRRELASAKFLAKCNQLSSQCALNQEMVTWFNHPPESLIVQAKEFMAAASADSGTARLTYGSPPWSRTLNHIQTNQLTAFHSMNMTTSRPHQVEQKWQDHLQVYTDGARAKDGRSSAAFVAPAAKVKQQHRIESRVSSLSCEKLAILLATKWIESVRPAPQKVVIFTDSKRSVSDLQRPADSLAEATVRTCRDIQAGGTEITVCWIPGHLGIAGNVAADDAAKSALSLSPSIGIHRDLRDINYDLDLHSLEMWQSKWNTPVTSSGKFYLRHTPSVLQRPNLHCNSRREQVILSRCRTNTLWLNHRRFKIGKHPDGHCSWCKVKEDVEHILLECPLYAVERICTLTGITNDNLQIDSILDTTSLTAQQATLDFLSSTGIAKRLRLEAKEGRDSPTIPN